MAFLGEVAKQVAIGVENALAYGQIADLKDKLTQEKVYLEDEIRSELNFEEIVGNSEGLRRVLRKVETVAPTDSTVLIYGETGTGKELIARAVHNLSTRKANAFVKMNCAAIPSGLLESELFGHEKGAFTGAINQRVGRFELAHRGTMFLDEIGDVDLQVQPKLLKVLEEQRFRRLGETRDRSVNVRLIAATHQNLLEGENGRRFRDDLYFRISTIRLVIPPLRERRDDILPLSKQFLSRFGAELGRGEKMFDKDAEAALRGYTWPGNIRELRNVIERAVLLAKSATISERDLSFESRATSESTMPSFDNLTLEQIEKLAVERALTLERGRVDRAAMRLGIARSSLYHRVHKFEIDLSRF
jgi:formate hydrogenlyase transcriptional activator